MGHSVLSYDHPMVENWEERGLEWPDNIAGGFNNQKDDIMGYSFNHNWENEINYHETWYRRLNRFFSGIDHEKYDYSTSKGKVIIID